MEGVLDMDALQRLHILVEELTKSTTAGDEHLATATLAELKRRVRHDEVALRRVLQTLLDCLNLPHSQVRQPRGTPERPNPKGAERARPRPRPGSAEHAPAR
jgi:hypothetical protein